MDEPSSKYQVLLVQPNFKIGGGSFTGYWLPYSVGCLWSYASQYDYITENFNLYDIVFKRENPQTLIERTKHGIKPPLLAFHLGQPRANHKSVDFLSVK